MRVDVLRGPGVLATLGGELDALLAASDAPVTARRPWLATWLSCHPGFEPQALLVRRGGELSAAALLVARRGRLVTDYLSLGTGLSDQARLPALDAEAAAELARALVAHVRATVGPWHLRLRHLPPADPVATRVAAELGCVELGPGDPSPALSFGAQRSLRAHVSKNHHQQVRRMLNRMRSEGLEPAIEHLRSRSDVEARMDAVEEICLRRDVELRGFSLLDRAPARAFFRAVILEHAERGEVELTTLSLRGRLAAYVVCFLDGRAHRMWNCRLDPEWSRYGVGRIANNAALERALADPRVAEFDWMRGDEPYKLSMSNRVERALDLRAWSTPALRAALDSTRRIKTLVKSVVAGHEWLQPALEASQRVKSAGRRARRSVREGLRRARG